MSRRSHVTLSSVLFLVCVFAWPAARMTARKQIARVPVLPAGGLRSPLGTRSEVRHQQGTLPGPRHQRAPMVEGGPVALRI